MALQFSVQTRNARLDAVETQMGASPKLRTYTGAPPANTAAAASGTLLAELPLPADPMSAASGGTIAKNGSWTVAAAAAAGTFGYFRIWDNAGTYCIAQGTMGIGGSGADMIVDAATITAGQSFTITAFSFSDVNA